MNKLKRWGGPNLSTHMMGLRFALVTLLMLLWMTAGMALPARAGAPVIIALGDSLTAGYGLAPTDGFVPQLQAALNTNGVAADLKNAGVSGDTSSGGLARLDWALAPNTKGVILALGANDMLRGIQPELTRRNLETIITTLRARNIQIMLVGMLAAPNLGPAYERQFNAIYPDLAAQYGLVFYPFFLNGVAAQRHLNLPDGIHPNREGIARIVTQMTPQVVSFVTQLK